MTLSFRTDQDQPDCIPSLPSATPSIRGALCSSKTEITTAIFEAFSRVKASMSVCPLTHINLIRAVIFDTSALDHITDDNRDEALELLRELSELSPRAAAPRRLALTVATGVFCVWIVADPVADLF